MTMHLSQLKAGGVIARNGDKAHFVKGSTGTYALAVEAIAAGLSLEQAVDRRGLGDKVDLVALAGKGLLDAPVRHPDAAHCFLTGTGLTHTGSASARDAMHADTVGMSDSMKMFRMGIEGGKPAPGQRGVQPEWFYKGTGTMCVAPGDALQSPDFALDGGEEPEIAGAYIIGPDGVPNRLGFCLANEFSDHVTEKVNYLFLAHSKLRPAAFGPELLVGELPQDIRGTSRILRADKVIWEKPFLSGEANMSHTIANLEYHHFKYAAFCQPGDLHLHMFGTATLSFADGVKVEPGYTWEISAPDFGLPLTNRLTVTASPSGIVRKL